ncbi:MAG: TIGR04282 family arsenosugar biosynthesis glycosyltransferase [Solirubrobacterales bacterium]
MLPRLLVIAKSPAPGRSKTRLCPPCTPEQAATLAEASLRDTLAAVAATDCPQRLLVLDGEAGDWLPGGFEVVPQSGGGLAERLEAAFRRLEGPSLLVGMDTPQLTPALLEHALGTLSRPGVDAVLGAAEDGGYWAIGFASPVPGAFAGVPMSSRLTGARQRRRLAALGLRVAELPVLRDVDEIADARAVARQQPGGAFARALDDLEAALCAA